MLDEIYSPRELPLLLDQCSSGTDKPGIPIRQELADFSIPLRFFLAIRQRLRYFNRYFNKVAKGRDAIRERLASFEPGVVPG